MEVRNMNQMQKAYKPLNCSQIMAAGSKSFYAASRLFPARLRVLQRLSTPTADWQMI